MTRTLKIPQFMEKKTCGINENVISGNPLNNSNLTDSFSNVTLNDVHPENLPILLTDTAHVTNSKPLIWTFSHLNPSAKIYINKEGYYFRDKQLLTNYSDNIVCNKVETGNMFSMHTFQLSCFMYFCYILSVCVCACMCTPTESISNDLIGNNFIPNINNTSQVDIDIIYGSDTNDNSIEGETPDILLNNLRLKNLKRLIIGHLNINSIRNKFDALKQIIKNNLDILIVSESKLDHTFPDKQFSMDGYRIIRQDREHNGHQGEALLFLFEKIFLARN